MQLQSHLMRVGDQIQWKKAKPDQLRISEYKIAKQSDNHARYFDKWKYSSIYQNIWHGCHFVLQFCILKF